MNKYESMSNFKQNKKKIFRRVSGSATMCLHKTKFSKDAAKIRAKEITKQGTVMRYYECPHCLNWHLSRVKNVKNNSFDYNDIDKVK